MSSRSTLKQFQPTFDFAMISIMRKCVIMLLKTQQTQRFWWTLCNFTFSKLVSTLVYYNQKHYLIRASNYYLQYKSILWKRHWRALNSFCVEFEDSLLLIRRHVSSVYNIRLESIKTKHLHRHLSHFSNGILVSCLGCACHAITLTKQANYKRSRIDDKVLSRWARFGWICARLSTVTIWRFGQEKAQSENEELQTGCRLLWSISTSLVCNDFWC